MNAQKMTQKSLEALGAAQNLAIEYLSLIHILSGSSPGKNRC